MLDELDICLRGPALKWLTSLPNDIRINWMNLQETFMYHFGGGAKPTRVSLAEMKRLRQGNTPMTGFGPKLADLLDKAGIHGDELHLDYFMDRVQPELKNALIISRPKDLRQAITIATEIEYGSGPMISMTTDCRLHLRRNVMRFGCPKEILSDRGGNFTSNIVKHLYNETEYQSQVDFGVPPRTNGKRERLNGTLKSALRKYTKGALHRWDDFLNAALFSCRIRNHNQLSSW